MCADLESQVLFSADCLSNDKSNYHPSSSSQHYTKRFYPLTFTTGCLIAFAALTLLISSCGVFWMNDCGGSWPTLTLTILLIYLLMSCEMNWRSYFSLKRISLFGRNDSRRKIKYSASAANNLKMFLFMLNIFAVAFFCVSESIQYSSFSTSTMSVSHITEAAVSVSRAERTVKAIPGPAPIQDSDISWKPDQESIQYKSHTMSNVGLLVEPFYFGQPSVADKKEVSIMTQMTPTKFKRLLDLHGRWKSYISVAVYLEAPFEDELLELRRLKEIHFGSEGHDCNVSFHLVFNNGSYTGEYPVNVLRNVAMDNVVTDYALMLDVDFIPSPNTHASIVKHLQQLSLKEEPQALVVPAFERKVQDGEVVDAKDLPLTKEKLLDEAPGSNSSRYCPFHDYYFNGHGPTNFTKWYGASDLYTIEYVFDFEPYLVVYRPTERLPRFWESFTGFGKNKQSWIEELSLAGYTFHVLPDSFLVHINHDYGVVKRLLQLDMLEEYKKFQRFLKRNYHKRYFTRRQLKDYVYMKTKDYWKVLERLEREKFLAEDGNNMTRSGKIEVKDEEAEIQADEEEAKRQAYKRKGEGKEDFGPGLSIPEPINESPWMNASSPYFQAHAMDHEGFKIMPFFFGRPPQMNIDTNEVTVVTQMTFAKKKRLEDLVEQWGDGYISVVLYLEAPYQEALGKIRRWKNKKLGRSPGNVSIHLVLSDGSYSGDYPINMLRNIAMDNVVTDYIFMIDIDFIPSHNTRQDITDSLKLFDLENEKKALIVPAFERVTKNGERVRARDLPQNKAQLIENVDKYNGRVIAPFHNHFYPVQGPTNFSRWYRTNSSYEVSYELNYEPYIVLYRPTNRLPRFWEHFTGFGRNKLSWIEELAVAGYSFHVLPDAYLIHINHEYSADRIVTPGIVRSYDRFLAYIRQQYGKSLWEREAYRKWKYQKIKNYKAKMAELGLPIESMDNFGNKRGVKATSKDW